MPHYSSPIPEGRVIRPTFKRRLMFFLFGVFDVFVRLATAPWRMLLKRKDKTVFIYEPYGMGDVLAAQPLAKAFLDNGYNVIFAGQSAWKEIFPAHENFMFIAVAPPYIAYNAADKYRGFFRELHNMVKLLKPFTSGAQGIDIRGDVRSIFIMYLAGCKKVETLEKYYTANDCKVVPFAAKRMKVLKGVSRRIVNSVFLPQGIEIGKTTLDHLMPPQKIIPVPKRIGLIPLTPWIGKQWIPEHWSELIGKLKSDGFSPVILCGLGETAKALAATATTIECVESGSIRDWLTHIQKCETLITVNTGPMHIAAILDKPMIVLEGSSRIPLWAPESERAVVLHHQNTTDCAPCHQVGDTTACGRQCMLLIKPDEVVFALGNIISYN